PLLGGTRAQLVGLRRAFIVTALFYLAAAIIVFFAYDERAAEHLDDRRAGRVTVRNVLAFENFIVLMGVIFGLQIVDRSFGPVLPLFVVELGVQPERVAIVSGVLFSISAATAAVGHHLCGRLLKTSTARRVIVTSVAGAAAGTLAYLLANGPWMLVA